jgi:hypothetical protein
MRRDTSQPYVGFAARVPGTDKEALQTLHPMKGGMTWWTETMLEAFLDLVETSPSVQAWVHDQIYEARHVEPPRALEEMIPKVRTDLYQRFNKLFGEKGATTWLIRTMLRTYLQRAAERPTPDQLVKEAVREVLGMEAIAA